MAPIKSDNQGDAISREVPEHALALIDAGGNGSERRYSYADLFRMSGAVARALQRRGLKRGERVAILSANRAEYLFTFLGAMQAGIVAVPVNWKLPAETVAFIVDDSDARLVIGDDVRLSAGTGRRPKVSYDSDFEALLASGDDADPSARCRCGPRSRRCSSIRRARPAARRVWFCRTTRTCG